MEEQRINVSAGIHHDVQLRVQYAKLYRMAHWDDGGAKSEHVHGILLYI